MHDDFENKLLNAVYEVEPDFMSLVKAKKDTDERIKDVDTKLRMACENINSRLAEAVVNLVPQLQATLSGGRCVISYKSKKATCWPDTDTCMWTFDNAPISRQICRHHSHRLPIKADDPRFLARGIASIFQKNFKSLRDRT